MNTIWHKSSHSAGNGNCLETRWHKSSRSGSNGCVEARKDGAVQVRDSKDERADAPILQFGPEQWTAFIDAIVDDTIRPQPVTT